MNIMVVVNLATEGVGALTAMVSIYFSQNIPA